MLVALCWLGIVGGIAGMLVTLLFKDPCVEQAEEILATIEVDSHTS